LLDGKICTECKCSDIHIDEVNGEIVCGNCGTVLSSTIVSEAPEWRSFDDPKRIRAGSPLTFTVIDNGVSSVIDWRDRDIRGNALSPEIKSQLFRLRKWDRRVRQQNSNVRTLTYALSTITKLSYSLKLPKNVVETAAVIFRKAYTSNLTKGRSTELLASAATYLACRQCNVLRSLKEIGPVIGISPKSIARSYRYLVQNLDSNVPKVGCKDIISRLVNTLSVTGRVERVSLDLLECAESLKMTMGRSPVAISAAAFYISCIICDEKLSQEVIAEQANITTVTIRNRYKELLENMTLQISL